MPSLEPVRAIFDASEAGFILIGMPGLEKSLAHDCTPEAAVTVKISILIY